MRGTFEHTNDKAGRRTHRVDSGVAFSSTQQNVFGYTARSEVTSASMRNETSSYEYDVLSTEDTRYYVWGLDLSQSLQGAGGVGGLLLVRQGTQAHARRTRNDSNPSVFMNYGYMIDVDTGKVHISNGDLYERVIFP